MANSNKLVIITANATLQASSGQRACIGATKREIMGVARELARRCVLGDIRHDSIAVSRYGEAWYDVDATLTMRWLVLCVTGSDTSVTARACAEVIRLLKLGTKRA